MNSEVLLTLGKIFEKAIKPLNMAMLFNSNEYQPYQCIFTNSNDFHIHKEYDLYEINSLLRTLSKKSNILEPELYKQLFQNDQNDHLCYILDFEENNKSILIFDLNQAEHFDHQLFIETIKVHYDDIYKLFIHLVRTEFNIGSDQND